MSDKTFRPITDLEIVEQMSDNDTVLIERNGMLKRTKGVSQDAVKSVNGVTPDENGDVQIETSSAECVFPGVIIDIVNTTKKYDTNDVLKSTARLDEVHAMLDEGKRVYLRFDDNRIPIIQLVKRNELAIGAALMQVEDYGTCVVEIGWEYMHGYEVLFDSYRAFTDNGIEAVDPPHIAGGVFET